MINSDPKQSQKQVTKTLNSGIGSGTAVVEDNRPETLLQLKLQEVMQSNLNNSLPVVQREVDQQRLKDLNFHSIAKYLDNIPQPDKILAILNILMVDDDNGSDTITAMNSTAAGALVEMMNDQEKSGEAAVKWFKSERLVRMAEDLNGDLSWVRSGAGGDLPSDTVMIGSTGRDAGGQSRTNDFTSWIRGLSGPPNDQSRMNCWEAVLYSGWKAGIIPKSFIVKVYTDAIGSAQEKATEALAEAREDHPEATLQNVWPAIVGRYKIALADAFGVNGAQNYEAFSEEIIPRGHLVFFNGINHVALATGSLDDEEEENEIMSLWERPENRTDFHLTTVERVKGGQDVITHASPPW